LLIGSLLIFGWGSLLLFAGLKALKQRTNTTNN